VPLDLEFRVHYVEKLLLDGVSLDIIQTLAISPPKSLFHMWAEKPVGHCKPRDQALAWRDSQHPILPSLMDAPTPTGSDEFKIDLASREWMPRITTLL
jgi:hypothetical protein